MIDYTKEELSAEIATLRHVFDRVLLVDARYGTLLDPAELTPSGTGFTLPPLDERGRGMTLLNEQQPTVQLCQAVTVEGQPCVLCLYAATPVPTGQDNREQEALRRAITQYQEDLRHDYLTNAYNARYMDSDYRQYAEQAVAEGQQVGAVIARVNEYASFCDQSRAAGDCCLNTAAGLLQLVVGIDEKQAVLSRLEGGLFLIVTVGSSARATENSLREALECARREFNISLSRRGKFTVSLASAEWGETASWEQMISLAEQRLQNC